MKKFQSVFAIIIFCLLVILGTRTAQASMLTFNSDTPADNSATRTSWLAAIGISSPQSLVNFETGFTNGQNISGSTGLFPGGLVITDTSAGNAIIRSGSGAFGGSNPVGTFSLLHNEAAYLALDFASNPVDYVAFQDIDQAGTSIRVTFVGGSIAMLAIETTGVSGDSAEFFGIYRNDFPKITKVELDASGDGQWGIDTIEYGTKPSEAVPEPTTMLLLGFGLIGLAGVRRFRK